MRLTISNSYKISFQIGAAILTYSCTITDITPDFISFTDKFNKEYTYAKSTIISIAEVEGERE